MVFMRRRPAYLPSCSGSCGDHTATYLGPIERLGIDRLLAQRVRSPSWRRHVPRV